MSDPTSPRGAAASRRPGWTPAWLATAAMLIGVVVLVGWATGQVRLKSVVPGMITMKVNTAIGLILLAAATLALSGRRAGHRWLVGVCLAVTAGMALLTLCEYAFGIDLRIDNLVFQDYDSPRFPGRNAPATNFAFLGLCIALLLLNVGRAVTAAQAILMFVASAPLATLGGYLYQAPGMYQRAPYAVIALNTSVALMLLCIAGLFARPDVGIMAVVTSRTLAGSLARKLLPAAVGLPLAIGLLVLAGLRTNLYTAAFGSSLLVTGCAVFFAGAVCWTATLLSQTETARAVAERARQRADAERERLLTAERAARGEAERANRMKDEFLAVVSHELRTPLNAMLGWSHVLQTRAEPEDIAEGLKIIERNARAQTQIIDDLLDMSRIVAGKMKLDLGRVDLRGVVDAAVESIRPAALAKGVRVGRSFEAFAGRIDGDAGRLQQVCWNLLSNAIKFTPKGGEVHVALRRVGAAVELVVRDTGDGIDAAFLPHVFERFRQADASATRRHGGLGLGLSIVEQLAEMHGGSVRVASDGPGTGATFTLRLPAVDDAPHVRDVGTPERSGGPTASIEGLRVLVVDDEADARAMIQRLLERGGATVTSAASADEAVQHMADARFDVMVSDIGMPVADGYALLRRVRSLDASVGGATPAIALTAYGHADDRRRAMAAGFQMHIAKPFEPIELATLIATAARGR